VTGKKKYLNYSVAQVKSHSKLTWYGNRDGQRQKKVV